MEKETGLYRKDDIPFSHVIFKEKLLFKTISARFHNIIWFADLQ